MTDMHDTADLVSKALRRAWQLGQTYWQQADSEYQSHWKKADATQATFDQLIEDTRAAILTSNSEAQPAPSVPDGFSREDLEAVADGLDGYEKTVNVGNVTGGGDDHLESTTAYAARFIRAMLAAPETKP